MVCVLTLLRPATQGSRRAVRAARALTVTGAMMGSGEASKLRQTKLLDVSVSMQEVR